MGATVRVVTPDDLGTDDIIELFDGETSFIALRQHGLGTSLVKIFSEYIQEALAYLGLEKDELVAQGCSICTGRLDENGQPGRNERLHYNDFEIGQSTGCWIFSNPEYLYLTDGKACYKFVQVGIAIPMNSPRMCLGGAPNYTFGQSCFAGGKNTKQIIEPDTTLEQMAECFGLSYPLT